tara:strand:+ start:3794 stop:4132 length:339 start_codon:yes stop_codon:yes gene_type:complete
MKSWALLARLWFPGEPAERTGRWVFGNLKKILRDGGFMTGKNQCRRQFIERSEDKKTLVRPRMGKDQIGSVEFLTADANQVQVKGACFILDLLGGTPQSLFDRLALGQELPR